MAEPGRVLAGVWARGRALWLALVLLLLAPLAGAQQLAPIPALDSPVVDTTGTLDAASAGELESRALALQQRKGSQLQVLVVPTTRPEDIAQYAVRVYDQWRLGREGVDDGVLLVVAIDDRRVRIEVGYGLEGAIPDATASRVIQEYLVPRFRAGDFAGGIAEASGVLVALIDGEPLPEPMVDQRPSGSGGGWLAGLFAAFIVAQVVRGIFSRAPRPLRGLIGAGAAGGVALLFSGLLLVAGIGAMIGLMAGLASLARPGRYANDRGWGGGGWGGPPFGGGGGGFGGGGFGGGGGWGGGGGFSGGGGASGSW